MDLEPKPASLWWTSTYASEEKSDMILGTSKGCYKFPFEDEFKVLGRALNRQGNSCDAVEERMQSANKAFWKDIMIYKSKDLPWRVKCQRLVDHVYAVFSSGSDNWSWTEQTMENINGWETKTMTLLFRLKRQKDETWVEHHTRTCNMARKIWVQMDLPFLCGKIAESMWRAMGGVFNETSNGVIYSLKKGKRWRSTRWWHCLQTKTKEDPENRTRWMHKWRWHKRGNVWDKMDWR